MKKNFIINLNTGDQVEDFFMVKSFSAKMASNNKKYFDFLLYDNTGEINAKLWEASEESEDYMEGQIIKVRGIISEWNGKKQVKILKIRLSQKEDMCDLRDFIQAAPEEAEDMYALIMQYTNNIEDKELKKLTQELLEAHKEPLSYYPAAKKNHHAIMAGLLYHIKRMLLMAEKMCCVYPNLRKDYLFCGVILHDIAKLYEMNSSEHGVVVDYTTEGYLLGHIVQGIKLVEEKGIELGVDREKLLMVEHMILSHHNEPEFGSPKRPMFPEAEMLHYLDLIDARIYDMEEALKNTESGTFTDKIWTMHNRKLYKSKE